jgi:hypothetical protein
MNAPEDAGRYGRSHQAERQRQIASVRDWHGWAAVGAGTAIPVPTPGPDEVVIAICGADGARASTVVSRATLSGDGIMPSLLEALEDTQAEVRARKDAG